MAHKQRSVLRQRPWARPPDRRQRVQNYIQIALAQALRAGQRGKAGLSVRGERVFMPVYRNDGVGVQAMLRIALMSLARQTGGIYVHMPFMELAHQNIDATGRTMSPEDWAVVWEHFLNLGDSEFLASDLVQAVGLSTLCDQLADEPIFFGDPKEGQERLRLPGIVQSIRRNTPASRKVWLFNLGLCRQAETCNLYLDSSLICDLQERFARNGYRPSKLLFRPGFLHVAIHIRRGDVWNACQAGSTDECFTNKLVTQEYYVALLDKLWQRFQHSSLPLKLHIFSDGTAKDFDRFRFTSKQRARLRTPSGTTIQGIELHLCECTLDTLWHLANAPVFVPGKSTFSVLAAILNRNTVLHEPEITDFYQFALLRPYLEARHKYAP